jgi:hypothetical protein
MVLRMWSFPKGPSSPDPSSVSQQHIKSLVDEVAMLMQSSINNSLLLEGDASLYHVFLQSIQLVVERVVVPMQSSTDPTLLLESDESTKVIMPMQYLAYHTLILKSNPSIEYVLL